jgi:hypothetical protein
MLTYGAFPVSWEADDAGRPEATRHDNLYILVMLFRKLRA